MKQFAISLLAGVISLPVSFWALGIVYRWASAAGVVRRTGLFPSLMFSALGAPVCAIASFAAVFFLIGRAKGDLDD